MRAAPVIPDQLDAMDALGALGQAEVPMALVHDEYGHFEGIVTSGDLLEAITGVFQEEEGNDPAVVVREDGSYLISGWMPVDEFGDRMGIAIPRDPGYETVAGYVLSEINRLPKVGETFERGPWRFEVVDLDGRRIDKIMMTRVG
jgi:putative hemolysin